LQTKNILSILQQKKTMKEGYCVLDRSVINQVMNESGLNAIILVHSNDSISKDVIQEFDAAARRINLAYHHRTKTTKSEKSTDEKQESKYIFCRIMKSEFPLPEDGLAGPITVVLSKGGNTAISLNQAMNGQDSAEQNIPSLVSTLTSASRFFKERRLQPITVQMDVEMDKHRVRDQPYYFVYYYRESEPIVPLMHNLDVTEPFINAFIGQSEATWQLIRRPQLMAQGIAVDIEKVCKNLIDIRYPCIFDMRTNQEYCFQDAINWILSQ
jgi:hypothetical protein